MKRLFAAALALSLLTGSLAATAYADGRDNDHRRDDRHEHRDDRHDDHGRWNRHDDHGRWDRNDHRDFRSYDRRDHDRYHAERYYRPYGYRYYSWHRGDRLPRSYYESRYVVRDYGAYRLRSPPRGYYWVRVDNDVVLTAIATGVVLEVVNGLFD